MAQAEILHRTRAQRPGRDLPGTIFCAPEILHEGIGVSPVNGGRGVARLWAGTPIGAHPRRSFGFFPIAGKETRPTGRNPPSGMKPIPKLAGGSGDPPLRNGGGNILRRRPGGRPQRAAPTVFQANHSRIGQREGRAPPLRRFRQKKAEQGRRRETKKDEAPEHPGASSFYPYCARLRSFIPCSYSRREASASLDMGRMTRILKMVIRPMPTSPRSHTKV